jgi:hypothetical protein
MSLAGLTDKNIPFYSAKPTRVSLLGNRLTYSKLWQKEAKDTNARYTAPLLQFFKIIYIKREPASEVAIAITL